MPAASIVEVLLAVAAAGGLPLAGGLGFSLSFGFWNWDIWGNGLGLAGWFGGLLLFLIGYFWIWLFTTERVLTGFFYNGLPNYYEGWCLI